MNERRCDNCKHCKKNRLMGDKFRCIRWSSWVHWDGCCDKHEWRADK